MQSQASENGRVKAAILGSGNIGTDLMYKLLKEPGHMELTLLAGIVPESEGLERASAEGVGASHHGIDAILEDPEIKIVFDATSAKAHVRSAGALREAGKVAVDMTPAALGPYVVPVANLGGHLEEDNVNLMTCGAQATTPMAYAVSRVAPVEYAEMVSTVASASAGPGTRQNIDEFTFTTARGLEQIGGAKHGKAIIILNPADPPIMMRNTVYVVPEGNFDEGERRVGEQNGIRGTGVRTGLPPKERARLRQEGHPLGEKEDGSVTARGGGGRGLPAPLRGQPGHHDLGGARGRRVLRTPYSGREGGNGMKAPRITDASLRDGSHPMAHQFTAEQVRDVARALDEAGIPVIEVSHGDGLAGASIQYGFSATPEMDLISEAAGVCEQARIASLLLPGIGTVEELKEAARRGTEIVRIATQCTEADVSEEHFSIAKELGLETVGFLMMAHMREPEFLVEQARLMESYGADCVYIVDSAGALLPDGTRDRVAALKEALSCEVGFHAHDNLGVAIGNSVEALKAGADQLDGSLRGLGAGAGNAPTELLAAVLDRMELNPGLDVFRLMDAAEYVIAPMMPFQPGRDRDSITIGYAGVYSTFLLHAKHAAERYGLDPRDVLVELGRRQAVAGQEDWILDVAVELAREKEGVS